MKAWKDGKGVTEISKKEWDKLFRQFHPPESGKIDFRELPDDIKSEIKCDICPDCGGIGVSDYDFGNAKWIIACRECRKNLS